MKKLLAILLALALVFSFAACNKNKPADSSLSTNDTVSQEQQSEINTSSEQASQPDTSSDTPSSSSIKNSSSSKKAPASSSSRPKPTAPTKLNPKTDFKWGKYVAKYYSADKKTYTESILIFSKEYEALTHECATYYTKEECERLYGGDFGFDADNLNEDFSVITLDGVKYYTYYYAYENIPESFKITDANIRISPDVEKYSALALKADGTLVVETADNNHYGKVGTIYKLTAE